MKNFYLIQSLLLSIISLNLHSHSAAQVMSNSDPRAALPKCRSNQSPVVLVNGVKVEQCRNDPTKREVDLIVSMVAASGRDQNPEMTRNQNLCEQITRRGQWEEAKPYCVQASKLGSKFATVLLATKLQSLDPSLSDAETMLYLEAASELGEPNSSLLLGVKSVKNGDLDLGKKYLLRCFNKNIVKYSNISNDRRGYARRDLGSGEAHTASCTNLVFSMILSDRYPTSLIGLPREDEIVIEPTIEKSIDRESYPQYIQNVPWFKQRLKCKQSSSDTFDASESSCRAHDVASNFAYSELFDQNFYFDQEVQYRILVINDSEKRPLAHACRVFDMGGNALPERSDKICDAILMSHKVVVGVKSDGNDANGIAKGVMRVNYQEFVRAR